MKMYYRGYCVYFWDVANSAKIKHTRKIPDIRYVLQATQAFLGMLPLCLLIVIPSISIHMIMIKTYFIFTLL